MDSRRAGYPHPETVDYFVIRVTRQPGRPAQLAGVVERLGSGEKRWFAGGNELLWVMTAWSDDSPAHWPHRQGAPNDGFRDTVEVAP
jgi:hypothetical protein